ncbi:dihydrofolate reductase [Mycoplasmopsis agassizii]|uniref:dihydrofolate reductase n=1 Tax=Mycoplasmopsis agassizii TaxID=33922 RepID=UPI003526E1C5
MIKLIVAVGQNNLIGNKDKMPWHYPEEFKHFRNITLNHYLLFGRTTFLGLPAVLKNRFHYVLSTTDEGLEKADKVIHNDQELNSLFNEFRNSDKTLFISGGKSIYERYVNEADELIISRIKHEHQGDVYLNLNLNNFKLDYKNDYADFAVEYWVKK